MIFVLWIKYKLKHYCKNQFKIQSDNKMKECTGNETTKILLYSLRSSYFYLAIERQRKKTAYSMQSNGIFQSISQSINNNQIYRLHSMWTEKYTLTTVPRTTLVIHLQSPTNTFLLCFRLSIEFHKLFYTLVNDSQATQTYKWDAM